MLRSTGGWIDGRVMLRIGRWRVLRHASPRFARDGPTGENRDGVAAGCRSFDEVRPLQRETNYDRTTEMLKGQLSDWQLRAVPEADAHASEVEKVSITS